MRMCAEQKFSSFDRILEWGGLCQGGSGSRRFTGKALGALFMEHSHCVDGSFIGGDEDGRMKSEAHKTLGDSEQTLILSDLHLGAEFSRAADALHLLKHTEYAQLVLLGDIFADLDFSRLTGVHWKLLSLIRKLSNPKRKVNVVWVEGNHDMGLSNLMSHLVGVPVYQRYVWEANGRRKLAIHGHQFDRFVSKNCFLSHVGVQIFYQMQKMKGCKVLARQFDGWSTRWLRLTEKVASGAIAYARAGRIDDVFCGHTHVAIERHEDGVSYYNSGCWVGPEATYITDGLEGVEIHAYDGKGFAREHDAGAEHRYSSPKRGEYAAASADLFEQAGLPAFAEYESIRC